MSAFTGEESPLTKSEAKEPTFSNARIHEFYQCIGAADGKKSIKNIKDIDINNYTNKVGHTQNIVETHETQKTEELLRTHETQETRRTHETQKTQIRIWSRQDMLQGRTQLGDDKDKHRRLIKTRTTHEMIRYLDTRRQQQAGTEWPATMRREAAAHTTRAL